MSRRSRESASTWARAWVWRSPITTATASRTCLCQTTPSGTSCFTTMETARLARWRFWRAWLTTRLGNQSQVWEPISRTSSTMGGGGVGGGTNLAGGPYNEDGKPIAGMEAYFKNIDNDGRPAIVVVAMVGDM